MLVPWNKSYDQDITLKSRDITLPTKVHLVKAMVFPLVICGCESWTIKKAECWRIDAFELLVLEKIVESTLDCKEIQPVHPKGNQSWIFIGRTDAEAETLNTLATDMKNWLIGKGPDAGKGWRREKGTTEDEMVEWHHQLYGHEFEQAPEVGEGQGSLACCRPWQHQESDTTEWLNWLNWCWWHSGKESTCQTGDVSSIAGLGRSPGEENDNPVQYSCPENHTDRGAWQATVHGVTRVRHDWVNSNNTTMFHKRTRKWKWKLLSVSNSLWPYGLYSPWNSPHQNTGVGGLPLLQGIFLTQELNPGLLHYRQILYPLSHKGSPKLGKY